MPINFPRGLTLGMVRARLAFLLLSFLFAGVAASSELGEGPPALSLPLVDRLEDQFHSQWRRHMAGTHESNDRSGQQGKPTNDQVTKLTQWVLADLGKPKGSEALRVAESLVSDLLASPTLVNDLDKDEARARGYVQAFVQSRVKVSDVITVGNAYKGKPIYAMDSDVTVIKGVSVTTMPEEIELLIDPGDASENTIRDVLTALNDLHVASGGLGLEYQIDGTFVRARQEVPS